MFWQECQRAVNTVPVQRKHPHTGRKPEKYYKTYRVWYREEAVEDQNGFWYYRFVKDVEMPDYCRRDNVTVYDD